jgi:hypothetical protein
MTITLLDPRTGKPVIIIVPDERSNCPTSAKVRTRPGARALTSRYAAQGEVAAVCSSGSGGRSGAETLFGNRADAQSG